jgi:hypothetical protein
MSAGVLGRAVILLGLVCGLLAVSLPFVSGPAGSARYVDDGTTAAFLLVLLALSSWFPAEVGSGTLGAALGAAPFGFFLYFPAVLAFDSLGSLRAGAWLGLCTVLIPVGALVAAHSSFQPTAERRGAEELTSLLGIVLLAVGIWLPVQSGGDSFWNISSSGHALGFLMLLLASLNAALLVAAGAGRAAAAELRVVVAAASFGLLAAGVVVTAFEDFGSLGSGSWLEACAGLLLLLGSARWSALPARYEEAPASLSQSPR